MSQCRLRSRYRARKKQHQGAPGSLDGSTACDGLIGVDQLAALLAIKEVRDELDNIGNTGGAADEDNLMDPGLVVLRIAEHPLNRLEGGTAEELGERLKMRTGEGSVQVKAIEEGIDLNSGLGGGGECVLNTLVGSTRVMESRGGEY